MVSYTPSYVFKFLPTILNALPLTLWVIFLTVLLGSLLGAGLAWAQVDSIPVPVPLSSLHQTGK